MKRNTAQTIFRTVVFAGAMLGAPACKKNPPASTTPTNTATQPPTNEMATPVTPPAADPCASPDPCASHDPCADPCGGGERPRGVDDDGGGGAGRGFILS